jgi:hypothetical protein
MFQLINTILHEFADCFKRIKTWQWFVVVIIGFMVRDNHRGVTSIISSLKLQPELYHSLLHFFRSTGYQLETLYDKWLKIALKHATVKRISGRVVLLGDHIKVSKEGKYMPSIQTLHQESQNSGKPSYIEGHNFGQVCAVITNSQVSRGLPLITEMQNSPPKKADTNEPDGDTLVIQMVNLVHKAAKSIGEPVVVALDAYFSSKNAWATADTTTTATGERLVEIVTRAQTNTVGYTVPEQPKLKKRGQPRKYGDRKVLYDFFSDMSKFVQSDMILYGKQTKVHYLCVDLIWRPVKKLVRFVLVEMGGERCVLMSTSFTLQPEEIIEIYALRFKIETSFAEQKGNIGSFAYHFWTKALPRKNKWKSVEQPSDKKLQKRIENTKRATESFVCLCTIATGILSIIAFYHSCEIWKRYPGWVRTLRTVIPTVAIIKETIAYNLPVFLRVCPYVPFCSIINHKKRSVEFLFEDIA